MAKAVVSFEANDGTKHQTPEAAAIVDLAAVLGHREPAVARVIIEKRLSIEAVFAELDAMTARVSGGPKAVR
jgi:hypothetical protein